MTFARAWSVALVGVEGRLIEVEAYLGGGLPRTVIIGLADASLAEARDRTKAAVLCAGFRWPPQALTVNLSPATLPKTGSHYDLAIVAAVMAALGDVPVDSLEATVLLGELGLDARVRPVRGVLPALLAAADRGLTRAIVPALQVGEASLVEGLSVWGVQTLGEVAAVLRGEPVVSAPPEIAVAARPADSADLRDVVGQAEAKFALEVAAAGRHHLFMTGPPGVGKTLLAERLPGLLPELDLAEALEVSAIHSLTGEPLEAGLIRRPPYADPHHSASIASMVGGGAMVALPGSVSMAHRGVLFLDEAPEFSPKVMEALRVPLESGRITLGRSLATTTYPARFQLVMAANPCPCGRYGVKGAQCHCPPMSVRRYAERLSGPVLDRVDLTQRLLPMRRSYLRAVVGTGEDSTTVAARVLAARERQAHRFRGHFWRTNGEVPGPELRRRYPLPDGVEILDAAVATGRLSARGVDKVLRVSWTLADLDGAERPLAQHLHTALALRCGDDGRNDGRA